MNEVNFILWFEVVFNESNIKAEIQWEFSMSAVYLCLPAPSLCWAQFCFSKGQLPFQDWKMKKSAIEGISQL